MNLGTIVVLLMCLDVFSFGNLQLASTSAPAPVSNRSLPPVVTVPQGTPVRVHLVQEISSKKAHAGDKIDLEVLEEVRLPNGEVVIPKGAKAFGHVIAARAPRRLDRRGTLDISIDSVQSITGDAIPVQSESQVQGASSTGITAGAIIVTALFVSGAGSSLWLLRHGHDAELPQGSSFIVVTKQPEQVDLGKAVAASGSESPLLSYQLAFLRRDASGMQRELDASTNSLFEDALLAAQSDTDAFYGRLSEARRLTQRAIASSLRINQADRAAVWEGEEALHEAEAGDSMRARKLAQATAKLSHTEDAEILAALAFARAGDSKHAQKVADQLDEKFRFDAALNTYWLPTITAAIALSKHKPKDALAALAPTQSHEMDTPVPFETGTLYPAFLRGEASLTLKKADAAVDAFQTILAHPDITVNYPLASLAHLQLARAYRLQKQNVKSCSEYQQFLNLWQSADSDTPVFQQAKQESSMCNRLDRQTARPPASL